MACLHETMMLNPKYQSNKKNGGNIPEMKDERTKWIPIPCGKCMACKKKKANKWRVRLMEEVRQTEKKAYFVTLTFNDKALVNLEKDVKKKVSKMIKNPRREIENNVSKQKYKLVGYNLDNQMAIKAVHYLREKIRDKNRISKSKEKMKYWLVTELGGNDTERLHMHGIMWTNQIEMIEKIWEDKYGYFKIGDGKGNNWVSEQTVNYIIKYVTKQDFKHKYYESRIFASTGLGAGYLKREDAKRHKYNGEKTNTQYTTRDGRKYPLDKYYKDKLLTDEEREELWLHELDKKIRYVDGKEIDVSKGEEEFNKMVEEARKKAKVLGYNDNTVNEEMKNFENNQRLIKKNERNIRVAMQKIRKQNEIRKNEAKNKKNQ